MTKKIQCPFCFERFGITIFLEDGEEQDLILDCEICCHPLEIHAHWNTERERFDVDTDRSSGF